jgi:hypothetical protein
MDSVEIQETEDVGKAVVAKCNLVPGSLGLKVFREKALIIFPPCDDRVMPPWGPTSLLRPQAWSDYLHFMKQEKEVQANVLSSFYVELDGTDAHLVNAFVAPYLDSPEQSAKTFTHLFMVMVAVSSS